MTHERLVGGEVENEVEISDDTYVDGIEVTFDERGARSSHRRRISSLQSHVVVVRKGIEAGHLIVIFA